MKIAVVEPLGISESTFASLKSEFEASGHNFTFHTDRNEDPQVLAERMRDADIVVVSNIKLSADTLSQCRNLKMLSIAFTGLDHVDLDYCQRNGIVVKNAAGYSTTAVSELTVALMLDLLRQVTPFNSVTRQSGSRGTYAGSELRGKTVGIVGTGAIGCATARLLKAFGCNLIAYSRTQRTEATALGIKYMPLDTMLPLCDILTLHLPLNQETHHLIDSHRLSLLKPTALLVNTARGNVVDIPALAEALKNRKLAGAAVDVYEQEPPLPPSHPLFNAPNCIMLPHIGYATTEAFAARADIVMNNVRQFIDNSKQQ
ncbi:MAG: hydroxyacid dehydrogenase [Bacteroidales bacterium]|nr:hydroxyacid dehydrogenase [Bacteroidales bacterium]